MKRFWTKDMLKAITALSIIGTLSVVAAFAQDTMNKGLFPIGPEGALVKPIGQLPIFESKPSSWVGNAFNSEVGEIDPDTEYRIVDIASYASFAGPDLWVELMRVEDGASISDGSKSCIEGCWAYLGKKDSYIVNDTSNPGSFTYGNFDFQQYMLPLNTSQGG